MGSNPNIKMFEACVGFLAADIQDAVPGSTKELKVCFLQKRFAALNCSIRIGFDSTIKRISLMGSFEQLLESHQLLLSHVQTIALPGDGETYAVYFDEYFGDVAYLQPEIKLEPSSELETEAENPLSNSTNDISEVAIPVCVADLDSSSLRNDCITIDNPVPKKKRGRKPKSAKESIAPETGVVTETNIATETAEKNSSTSARKTPARKSKLLAAENWALLDDNEDEGLVESTRKRKVSATTKPKLANARKVSPRSDSTLTQEKKALQKCSKVASTKQSPTKGTANMPRAKKSLKHYSVDELKALSKYFYIPFSLKRTHCNRQDIIQVAMLANKIIGFTSEQCFFQCVQCKVFADNVAKLDEHIASAHKETEATGSAGEWNHTTDEVMYSCTACDVQLSDNTTIHSHVTKHISEDFSKSPVEVDFQLVCPQHDCSESYAEVGLLENHVIEVHGEVTLTCRYCSQTCVDGSEYKRHMSAWHCDQQATSKLIYAYPVLRACPVCQVYTTIMSDHASLCHPNEKTFTCPQCNKSYVSQRCLTHHMKTHSDKFLHQPSVCEYCGETFLYAQNLRRHLRATHVEAVGLLPPVKSLKFKCPTCGLKFISEQSLQKHTAKTNGRCISRQMNRQSQSNVVICSECGVECRGEIGLNMHRAWRHPRVDGTSAEPAPPARWRPRKMPAEPRATAGTGEQLVCSKCGRTFPSGAALHVHEAKMHGVGKGSRGGGLKPRAVTCKQCNERLPNFGALVRHKMLVHRVNMYASKAKEGKTPCKVCGKMFDSKRSMSIHFSFKHVEGGRCKRDEALLVHACSYCGKKFSSKYSRDYHERAHRGEKTDVCAICGKLFTCVANLRAHMAALHGVKDFQHDPLVNSIRYAPTCSSTDLNDEVEFALGLVAGLVNVDVGK